MQYVQMILAAIVTLGVLVAVHEWGHFYVARRMGVKVLRFSIGFGPILHSWWDKHGTEYALSAVPLGGYVKMLDEREGPVEAHELDQAFTRKSVWARMAIVAAGPLVNLVFAVFLYWWVFMAGVQTMAPVVGSVTENSPAAQAGVQIGDEIVAVDAQATESWQAVGFAVLDRFGEEGALQLSVRRAGATQAQSISLAIHSALFDGSSDPLLSLGLEAIEPVIDPVISEIEQGSVAQQQGLQQGDKLLRADGQPIVRWQDWVRRVRNSAGKPMRVELLRKGQTHVLTLTPASRMVDKQAQGYLGAGVASTSVRWPEGTWRKVEYGPVDAAGQSLRKTGKLIVFTLDSIWKMIKGLISVDNISGPITIAKVAGQTANLGWQPFVEFMALLSISLGVLNLLPVPVLDGGHLLYYSAEALLRRPVPEWVQAAGSKVGLTLLLALMVLAFYNDIMRSL